MKQKLPKVSIYCLLDPQYFWLHSGCERKTCLHSICCSKNPDLLQFELITISRLVLLTEFKPALRTLSVHFQKVFELYEQSIFLGEYFIFLTKNSLYLLHSKTIPLQRQLMYAVCTTFILTTAWRNQNLKYINSSSGACFLSHQLQTQQSKYHIVSNLGCQRL